MTKSRLATLRKYGLTVQQYQDLLDRSDNKCEICRRPPAKRALAIDHQHVRGWAKMPPLERVKYVRGLLCWQCNTGLRKWRDNIITLRHAANYLYRYELLKERLIEYGCYSV